MGMFESVLEVAPIINHLFFYDGFVNVTDQEKYVAYYPGEELDINIQVGSAIRQNGINDTVIKNKERVMRSVPRDVYGIPYIAIGIPIIENGVAVGCLSTGVSIDHEERIKSMADNLTQAVDKIVTNTDTLQNDALELDTAIGQVADSTTNVHHKIDEISELSTVIKNISSKTNILGINAAIEAARAGSYGKGFSVVADEVRELSNSTSTSTQNISGQLAEMTELMTNVSTKMKHAKDYTHEQTAGIQELNAVIKELQEMVVKLREMAKITND